MAQFDVYSNRGQGAALFPYLLDVQHALLDGLATRLVIPLTAKGAFPAAEHLNPEFTVVGRAVVAVTQEMGAYPAADLTGAPVASLASESETILRAIDLLFSGV